MIALCIINSLIKYYALYSRREQKIKSLLKEIQHFGCITLFLAANYFRLQAGLLPVRCVRNYFDVTGQDFMMKYKRLWRNHCSADIDDKRLKFDQYYTKGAILHCFYIPLIGKCDYGNSYNNQSFSLHYLLIIVCQKKNFSIPSPYDKRFMSKMCRLINQN